MTATTALDARPAIAAAVQAISSQCDGAHDLDGVGFNGVDAPFGNTIAGIPADGWRDEWVPIAYNLLRTYRRQLADLGIDYDQLPVPEGADAAGKRLSTADVRVLDATTSGLLEFQTRGDEHAVARVKTIPGREFDWGRKVWLVPVSSAASALRIAEECDFVVTPAAKDLIENGPPPVAPAPRSASTGTVELVTTRRWGTQISVDTPYDARQVTEMRQIDGRAWDDETQTNRFPRRQAARVVELAALFEWDVAPDVVELALANPDCRPMFAVSVAEFDIAVRFDFEETLTYRMNSLGGRWHGTRKAWLWPLASYETLLARLRETGLVTVEGDTDVEDRLTRVQRLEALSSAVECDPVDVPGVGERCGLGLRPAQHVAVRYVQEAGGRLLIGDPTGAGKTLESIASVVAMDAWPAVFVVPPGLTHNWMEELNQKWLPRGREAQLLTSNRPWPLKTLTPPDAVVIGYSVLHSWVPTLVDFEPKAVIFDESHRLKNKKARRTEAATEFMDAVQLDLDLAILCTATGIKNRRPELIEQLRLLGRLDAVGGPGAVKTADDLNRILRGTCYLRRTKRDLFPDLDDPRHVTVHVEGDPKVMKQYRLAEENVLEFVAQKAAAIAEEAGDDPRAAAFQAKIRASAAEFLIQIGILRRLAGQAKKKAAVEWTRNFAEENDSDDDTKLLVFAQHLDVLHAVASGVGAPTIEGATAMGERQALVNRFQNRPHPKVLALQSEAGGEGITLTAAWDLLICELDWSPATHQQQFGRCYGRSNDPHGATGWYLAVPNTIDDRMVRLLVEKQQIMTAVLDGDRGNPEAVDFDADEGSGGSILTEIVTEMIEEQL
ncbi:MAG: DEAD/DEAH box helicase [Actinomycetota bacterium]